LWKKARPSQIYKTLPASLKDGTARMNDRNKHKVIGQINHQTANPKANASVFLFFSTAHFLKKFFANRTYGIFSPTFFILSVSVQIQCTGEYLLCSII